MHKRLKYLQLLSTKIMDYGTNEQMSVTKTINKQIQSNREGENPLHKLSYLEHTTRTQSYIHICFYIIINSLKRKGHVMKSTSSLDLD